MENAEEMIIECDKLILECDKLILEIDKSLKDLHDDTVKWIYTEKIHKIYLEVR